MSVFMEPLYLLVYFIFITFVAFYIPGDVLNRKLAIPHTLRLSLNLLLGFVVWAWVSYIFGLLSMRWLVPVVCVIWVIFWFYYKRHLTIYDYFSSVRHIGLITMVIALIGLVNILHNGFFNGVKIDNGILYFSDHPPDQMWHAALAQSMVQSFPPEQPMMSGVVVRNYHVWGDMVSAELSRVFKVPISSVVFQYSSILIWFVISLATVSFARLNRLGRSTEWFLLFLLLLSGDALMFLLLFLGNGLSFEMKPLESSSTILTNFPRAYGLMVLLGGLSYLTLWIQKKSLYIGLLSAVIFSTLMGFKANIGVVAGVGFLFLGAYFLYRKSFNMIIPVLVFIPLSLLVHLPLNSQSGGLVFSGFWIVENFIVQPSLGLSRLELARAIFYNDGKIVKALFFDILYMPIFLFGILGIKLFGLIPFKNSINRLKKELNIFLYSIIISSLLLGTFFIQQSGGSNSFNFISTAFHVLSIYTALFVTCIFSRYKKIKVLIITLAILVAIPRSLQDSIDSYEHIIRNQSPTIRNEEIEQYEYIKSKTNEEDIFLTADLSFKLHAERKVFLGNGVGLGILESHGISVAERFGIVDTIMKSSDTEKALKLIKANNITYLLEMPENPEIKKYLSPVEFRSQNLMYKVNY